MVDVRSRGAIDDVLVGLLGPAAGEVVLELGCGTGHTLLAAADAPAARLVGLDLDAESLSSARALLSASPATYLLVRADLARPLPLTTASARGVLCHNVLELLPDPAVLVAEASRVLRAGGTAVFSHTDFETVAISGADVDLTRRVVRAYATTPDPGAGHCDGQMGRKLAALVGRSPLRTRLVDAHVVLRTELTGPAEVRVRSMFATLRDARLSGTGDLSVDELDEWRRGLVDADRDGRFLYAHTTYIVVADKPPEAPG